MSPYISKFGLYFARKFSEIQNFYTKNHEWVKIYQNLSSKNHLVRAKIGITDYSQKALGDIVFIEMPKVETRYNTEDSLAVVESVKGASDVYCPVSGTITSINSAVLKKPSLLNKSPEDEGWICEIEIDNHELKNNNLLNHQEYINFCKNAK